MWKTQIKVLFTLHTFSHIKPFLVFRVKVSLLSVYGTGFIIITSEPAMSFSVSADSYWLRLHRRPLDTLGPWFQSHERERERETPKVIIFNSYLINPSTTAPPAPEMIDEGPDYLYTGCGYEAACAIENFKSIWWL